jgi:hypothetical protein
MRNIFRRKKRENYQYLLIQHTNKYWNGVEAFYFNSDEELSKKLKEIAKEQGITYNSGDIINDFCSAVDILRYIDVFEYPKVIGNNVSEVYAKKCSNAKIINLL